MNCAAVLAHMIMCVCVVRVIVIVLGFFGRISVNSIYIAENCIIESISEWFGHNLCTLSRSLSFFLSFLHSLLDRFGFAIVSH